MSDPWLTSLTPYLRDPPLKSWRRSAYEVEVNPWSRRGDVEAALLFRGSIVSAYGYIETILGEICIKASRLPKYAALRESFPQTAENRVSFLRRAFALDPLLEYQPWATLFLDRFEAHSEIRNLSAHARMQVLPDWGVTFRDLRRDGPMKINSRSQRMTIPELEVAAWRAARLSRLCQRLVNRLNRAEILARID
jgi:hypothetical protein